MYVTVRTWIVMLEHLYIVKPISPLFCLAGQKGESSYIYGKGFPGLPGFKGHPGQPGGPGDIRGL